ncbi:MAG: tetratricopeptide repeat protein [Bacteroidetes bacterium]|nr:tetratricopeptide repeat protein [Bacteroidota bacterium]
MQKLNIHISISITVTLLSFAGYAQEEKKILRKGNDAFNSGKPMEAANLYKRSLKEKQDYYKANFNLGDAYYKTASLIKSGKIPAYDKQMTADSAANLVFEQAAEQFDVVAKSVSNADTIQKAWHNYGNAKLMQKNYEDAILGYKKALKLNPKDEDTRYNLAYAQKQLAQQQKNQKDKDKDKKDDKKNEGNKPEDKKDKRDINNPNDKDKQEAQQPQMSKEQAEKMLNALKNDEKKMQALRKKKGDPAQKVKVEKDW